MGSLVFIHPLRYFPHITIGLQNLSVYWLMMQSNSVSIIAEVPTTMQSSRNEHFRVYFLIRLYFSHNTFLSSSSKLRRYAFHPGQNLVCQCYKRAMSDLGCVSYLRLILHWAHGYSFFHAFLLSDNISIIILFDLPYIKCYSAWCSE